MAVVVLTANYGGYDQIQPQVDQDIDTVWLCFTDDPDLKVPAPWCRFVSPPAFDHPCMAAKVHKCLPSRLEREQTDVIWIDANMQVTSRSFAREALAARHDGVGLFAHPRRDCIFREAEASLGAEGQGGKYAGLPIREQVESYRAEGYPEHAGLFACGTIAWDLTHPAIESLGLAWLAECDRWTWQDQLSFPVVARRLGIRPGVFPVPQIEGRTRHWLENRWLRIHEHLP